MQRNFCWSNLALWQRFWVVEITAKLRNPTPFLGCIASTLYFEKKVKKSA
jgi:hypothetical protein